MAKDLTDDNYTRTIFDKITAEDINNDYNDYRDTINNNSGKNGVKAPKEFKAEPTSQTPGINEHLQELLKYSKFDKNREEILASSLDNPIFYSVSSLIDVFRTRLRINTVKELVSLDYETIRACFTKGSSQYYFSDLKSILKNHGILFDFESDKYRKYGISDEVAFIPYKYICPRIIERVVYRFDHNCTFLGDIFPLLTDYEELFRSVYYHERQLISDADFDALISEIHSLGFKIANEQPTLFQKKKECQEKGVKLVGDELNLGHRTSMNLYSHGIFTLEDLMKVGAGVFDILTSNQATYFKGVLKKRGIVLTDNKNITKSESNHADNIAAPSSELPFTTCDGKRVATIEEVMEYNQLIYDSLKNKKDEHHSGGMHR